MKIEGGGVLEEIEVCHTHQQRGKRPSLFVSLSHPDLSFTISSVGLVSFGQEGEVHDSMCPCTSSWTRTCGALV